MPVRRSLFICLAALALACCAQEEDVDWSQAFSFTTELPADVAITEDVSALTRSVSTFDHLIEVLGATNDTLVEAMEAYLKKPGDELLASRLELELARHAQTLVEEFDEVASQRDGMNFHFNLIGRKLQRTRAAIAERKEALALKVAEIEQAMQARDRELTALAVAIKEAEARGEDSDDLRRDFRNLRKRLAIQERNYARYTGFAENYSNMIENVGKLADTFSDLQVACIDMLDNLSLEREVLLDQIRYQSELVTVRKVIRDSLASGHHALETVADTVVQLYFKVDTFSDLHTRISEHLLQVDTANSAIATVEEAVRDVGEAAGAGFDEDLDALIEHYAEMAD